MTDFTDEIFKTPPVRLAKLIGVSHNADDPLFSVNLGAILRYQLEAPIQFGVDAAAPDRQSTPSSLAVRDEPRPITCLSDLFCHPNPPLEWLRQVKDFAKTNREHSDGSMCKEISTVIYYAAIIVAFVRHGERITSLDNETLNEGIKWAQAQSWLDDRIRALLAEGTTALECVQPP